MIGPIIGFTVVGIAGAWMVLAFYNEFAGDNDWPIFPALTRRMRIENRRRKALRIAGKHDRAERDARRLLRSYEEIGDEHTAIVLKAQADELRRKEDMYRDDARRIERELMDEDYRKMIGDGGSNRNNRKNGGF